jgi:succinate-semialdehyde dehydrogenase/glutarate-semialdehyde dehydrogenase
MPNRTYNARTRVERRVEPPVYQQQVLRAVNPATFEHLGSVPLTPEARIPAMVALARNAGSAWGALAFAERAPVLAGLRARIAARAGEIARVVSAGMGKPLVEAHSFDVQMVLEALDDYLAHGGDYLADQPQAVPARLGDHKQAFIRHAPRGVVCVISPWNFPFELAMGPAITALAAGNAVLVKPTSAVPLVGELIESLFQEAFQDWPGLAQVVHGPGRVGTLLATAPGVDFVAFTGSSAVGRKLQSDLAPLLRPSLLELGGNDPMLVCADANLERAARAAVYGRFCNNGQVCAAVKRVYVHTDVAKDFLARVVEQVQALRIGHPEEPEVDLGPLANDRAIANLRALLHDALDKGARLEAGGFPTIQSGWFWPPTVLSNVDHSMRIMKEEAFGPILPIQTVLDDDEAVDLANDSEYGLDAYVFSADLARARRLADRLEAGSVDINEVIVNYVIRDLPFGGVKQSGINRCHGPVGLRLFTQCKAMLVDDGTCDREPHWFPYTAEQLQAARQLP